MKGTLTANDAAFLIQRLAEELARGTKAIDFNIDKYNNIRIGGYVAATVWDEGNA